MLYLMFAGAERFSIEFMRVNPRVVLGLSEAQLIALALLLTGAYGWSRVSSKASR